MFKEIETYKKHVEEAAAFLQSKIKAPLDAVIALGTGLGGLAKHIEAAEVIPYETVPNFPIATVESHTGNLIFGTLQGRYIAVLQGRFHYYEGYSTREVTLPVRVLSLLGADKLIITNAAGGLNLDLAPGSLMVIRDHMNFIPENPLRGPNVDDWGPRFPDLSQAYDQIYIERILQCADRLQMHDVTTGVYVAIPGPSLETPAETRFFRNCGADAIGMSTVPEVIVAKHAGMRVLGISVIANTNDPDNFKPVILEDVISQAQGAEDRFQRLILEFLHEL
jgi:purine-nucleoside phosphorylase